MNEVWAFAAGFVSAIPVFTWAGLRWGYIRGHDEAIRKVAEG